MSTLAGWGGVAGNYAQLPATRYGEGRARDRSRGGGVAPRSNGARERRSRIDGRGGARGREGHGMGADLRTAAFHRGARRGREGRRGGEVRMGPYSFLACSRARAWPKWKRSKMPSA